MPEILDDRGDHVLVKHEDGVELISWSPLTRLVWKHDLWGLLRDRDEPWYAEDDDGLWVGIRPAEDGRFVIETADITHVIGQQQFDDLVAILDEAYEHADGDEPSPKPIVDALGRLLDTEVNPRAVDPVAEYPTFRDHVEVRDDGWFIHDHLLLTYDNEFYHPMTESKERSGGSVIPAGSNAKAYELQFRGTTTDEQATLGEFTRTANVEFITRAKWAVDHTEPPGGRR